MPKSLILEEIENTDTYAWESAVLETPYGQVEIGGCLRTSYVKNVEGRFAIDGKRTGLEAQVRFTEDGFAGVAAYNLTRNERFGDFLPPPRDFKDTLGDAVREWADDPANMAMILRNEIKDRCQDIEVHRRNADSLRQELSDLESGIVEDEEKVARLEALLEGMAPASGRPRP